MACNNICKLCNNLILSQSITYDATTNNLIIDIPSGTYYSGHKYCIILAQSIPDTTTITAPVYVSIGGVTSTLYPLVRNNCVQVTACSLRSRTKYSTCVATDSVNGSFKLLGNVPCSPNNILASLPIAEPATPTDEATPVLLAVKSAHAKATATNSKTTNGGVKNE